MLEQILDFIHNYFIKEVYKGRFIISDGSINIDGIKIGQYFKIRGSALNDGIYKYPDDELTDEEFDGEVWLMAVPRSLVALGAEIEAWVDKYGEQSASPFSSESFGGYSYTKATGDGSSGSGGSTWQSVFGSRLNAYRKIS